MKTIRGPFICLCIIFFIHLTNGRRTSQWLTDFVSYVNGNEKGYQVLLIFDPNMRSGVIGIGDITRGISRELPTIQISFLDANKKKAEECSKFASFSSPRSTITVIVHLSEDPEYMAQLNRPIDFVSNISESRMRSKCLIVLPQERKLSTYEDLLKELWEKQFLDVTILEVSGGESASYLKSPEEIAIIHQWNLFTKTYNRFRFSPGISWFPDKTKNMHGYRMNVGMFNYPPAVFLERDDRGEVKAATGPDVELSKGLSDAMNFKIQWISPKNETSWGVSKVSKEKSTGHMYRIMNNEEQYIVAESGRFATAQERLFECSRGSSFFEHVAVVPIMEDDSVHILASWKVFNAFMVFGFFLMIWILCRMMNFDRSTWSFLNIIQLVLGFTTPREPERLVERIIFGAILISCMLHSSFIFSAFTDVSLTENPEMALETIDDVISSILHTVILRVTHMVLYEVSEGNTRILLDNSEIVEHYGRYWDDLQQFKNCSLIMRRDIANWMIGSKRDSMGRPLAKMVKESLRHTVSGLLMERRSPYVKRFDQVLLRLQQSGLVDKWQRTNYEGTFEIVIDDPGLARGSESILLQKQVTYILLFGYALAIVVYFIEVLHYFHQKKVNSRQERNREL